MRGFWVFCFGLMTLAGVSRTQDLGCEEAVAVGSGSGSLLRWTYDKSQRNCKAFFTKDSGIVRNIFLTEAECLRNCSAEYNQLYPEGDAACDLPVLPGPCLAHILMWHYDKEKGFCDTFIWGGCQGNGNRYDTKEECATTCVIPKKRSGGGSNANQPSEPQSDAGLIIGVVFGVVFGAAFLVTLSMYLVQRKKMKKQEHKRVPDTEMK